MSERDDFYEKVYKITERIPLGKVTSYGCIASCIGVKSGARMVGYALNNSIKNGRQIPAHRVVNRLGQLTGRAYFPGDTMRERLQQEGVEFVENYTVNIQKHFWDPSDS